MKVEEPLLEETLSSSFLKEDEEEELEETLSLCDLPLYSDQSADWDQSSSLNSNSTSSSSQQDFFEFFTLPSAASTATATAAASFPPENIIFCGKLIPYKKLPPCKTDASNQVEIKKSSRWRWKFTSTKNSKVSIQTKNGNKGTTALMHQQHKRTYNTTKQQLGKAKWYFFLFGVSRFSPVVELSDIRNRQSRRHRSQSLPLSPPSSPPPPPSLMFGFRNDKVSDRGGWGLWGLIRALSCGGNHYPAAVVTVADGGAPSE